MSFSGGTFSPSINWVNEAAAAPIEIAKHDTQDVDFATGLSNCILRDGTGLPTSAIPWNAQDLTGVGLLTAARVTVTASTIPANGLYLPAANTVGIASNTTLRWSVNSTGNHVFVAPSSGTTLTVSPVNGGKGLVLSGVTSDDLQSWTDGTRIAALQLSAGNIVFGGRSADTFGLLSNGNIRISIASTGNVAINAPSSGTALAITNASGANLISVTDGTTAGVIVIGGTRLQFGTSSAHAVDINTNGNQRVTITSAGNVTINAPSSGVALDITAVAASSAISAHGATGQDAVQVRNLSGASNSFGLAIIAGTNTNDYGLNVANAAGANMFKVGGGGNVTITAPSSGTALLVRGLNGQQSLDIGLSGATNNPRIFLTHTEASGLSDLSFTGSITPQGTISIGGSTAIAISNLRNVTAYETYNSINAMKSNATFETTTGTATLTGCTTSPTGTVVFARSGSLVTAVLPVLNATSNSSTCTMTGSVPAAFLPARINHVACRVVDNNAATPGYLSISPGTGTFNLFTALSAGFTTSGTKGTDAAITITWLLD